MGANTNARVAAAAPKQGGGIYWAPIDTALPTDASTALAVAYKCLGPMSEEGVRPSRDTSIEKVKEWDGSTLASLLSDESRSFEFDILGVFDADALNFIFQQANVTVTPASGGAGTKIATVDKGGQLPKGVLVLEMKYGNVKQRKVIPVGEPNVTGENPYIPGGLRGYTVTVEALKDSSGAFVYEYAELDDAPGA